jgi:HlyD family secretion protein
LVELIDNFVFLFLNRIMKKIIIIVSIIAIIAGGYFSLRAIFSSGSDYQLVEVARGEVTELVSVTGTVISAKQVDLEFETSGRVRRIEVEVGEQVAAGQVLVRLDTAELNSQLQSNQAALEIAQAKLAQTLAGTKPEEIQVYQTAVSKAEVEVANKEQALKDAQDDAVSNLGQAYEDVIDVLNDAYLKSDDAVRQKINDLFTGGETSNPQLDFQTADLQAENDAEWQRMVVSNELDKFKDEISALNAEDYNQLDNALVKTKEHLTVISDFLTVLSNALSKAMATTEVTSSDLATYRSDLNTARTNVNTALTGLTTQQQTIASTRLTNQTNLNQAQANLETARVALKKAQDELASEEAGPRQEDVDLAQAEVRQAQANLNQVREKINKNILKAPVAGLITAIEKEEGETASANQTIVSMISAGFFQIEANVSETEIAKVSIGDPVGMTLDALGPEEKFSGQVIKIDPAETVVSGVIYYKVTSIFDVEDERIKPGMTVNLDIQTDQKENVLYLPYYLVKERNGEKYVLVLENGQAKERTIRTGLAGETNIEIDQGLEEGEQVIIGE